MRLVPAFFFICAFHVYNALAAFTDNDFGEVEIGKPFNISWDASTPSPVNLTLVGDSDFKNPGVLHEISRIAASASGNSFQWTPSRSLNLSITYGMQLVDGAGDVELSQAFRLVDRAESSSVTSSSSSSAFTFTTSTPGSAATAATATAGSTQSTPPTSPTQTQGASSSPTSTPTPGSQTSANIRIAISMTIVTLLILIVVALIFYEHGKRVASRNRGSESASSSTYESSDRGNGSDGLQLFEGFHVKEPVSVSAACASCKSCPRDGGERGMEEGVGLGIETNEERKKKKKSMRSIYELG